MLKLPLKRNYTTGWYSLSQKDATDGMINYLLTRDGVKNISISSCYSARLEGDKGYIMHVSYDEDLDETFGFSEAINRVIFLDTNGAHLPYNIGEIAHETGTGIVITTPSIKDEFYDDGKILSRELSELMEQALKYGTKIVGITPSTNSIPSYKLNNQNAMEISIIKYLNEHPSIKNFLIVSKQKMPKLASYQIEDDDIPWYKKEEVKAILTKELAESTEQNRFQR